MYMYSTNSPSTKQGTCRTVICAAAQGQVASLMSSVSVADAPFPLSRAFAYVKEAQTDTNGVVRALNTAMVA